MSALARSQTVTADAARASRAVSVGIVARVRTLVETLNQQASAAAAGDRERLRVLGLALCWVASAAVVRYLLGATGAATTFLFFPVVVAFSASAGGWTAGLVAALASVVMARLTNDVGAWTSVLFVAECLAVTGVIVRLTSSIAERRQTLEAANVRIGELQTSDDRGHAIDAGSQRMEALATECAFVLLDRQGQVAEWRAGAERLYGHPAAAIEGTSAAALFGDAGADATFKALLADAARRSSAAVSCEQRRADTSLFDADVELMRAGDGFVMVVRDRTPEQQRQRTAAQAADAQRALRDEADLAQRQLATLQSVTDPSLNAWPPSHFVAELLERVRVAVNADGIALVLMKGLATPRVFSTAEGLHPQGLANRRMPDLTGTSAARIAFVQNDAARVVEESLLTWPDGISSLIAVPVVHAGEVEGIIEVVDRRGRRSTEWEIALVQVVAARVAGLARDHGYADTANTANTAVA